VHRTCHPKISPRNKGYHSVIFNIKAIQQTCNSNEQIPGGNRISRTYPSSYPESPNAVQHIINMFIQKSLWPKPFRIFVFIRILGYRPCIPSEQRPLRKIILFKFKVFSGYVIHASIHERAPVLDDCLDIWKSFCICKSWKSFSITSANGI
jgi:hypothetical protein